jgi:hypothetical protein
MTGGQSTVVTAKGRAFVLASGVAALGLLGALAGGAAREATAKTPPSRLAGFSSCGALLAHVKKQALPLVQPWGLGGSFAFGSGGVRGMPMPATATEARSAVDKGAADSSSTPEHSTTNVQEQGVDEPDFVKSNGRFLFIVSQGTLRAVDVRGRAPRLADSLPLPGGYESELVLAGNRLLVVSRGGYWVEPLPAMSRSIAPVSPGATVLREVDVSDPNAMKVVRTLTLEGSSYVTARLVGTSVRLVLGSAMPNRLPFVAPAAGTEQAAADAKARNRAVVSRSGIRAWLPTAKLKRRGAKAGPARPLVGCDDVRRPTSFSGLGLLTVLTIDLAKGLDPVDSDAILTDGRIVYASPESLYVATERWADRPVSGDPTDAPTGVSTAIHRFDISDPQTTRYAASGGVSGFLLSQWSLSEHKGMLRVASTEAPAWWGGVDAESESSVSVLEQQGGKLEVVGRVAGLGRGERIYAVRFIGDTGYVVTFRQVDPLYTLDLSNPRRPVVLGELKIQGYSAYLHPVGEDLLLGLGQDASLEGRVLGTQLSLFDVSNLRSPTRLAQTVVGPGGSEAEYDHHAFLHWPRTGLVAVPVQTYEPDGGKPPFTGAIGFRVSRAAGITELGRIVHGTDGGGYAYPIRRSLVVGDALYTVSDLGVRATSLAGFGGLGWAAFPQPKPVPMPTDGIEPAPR